jgi:hypothetical protein
MTYVRVKGFKIFRDRKPPFRWRCYHRASGIPIDLGAHPLGSASFLAECARIAVLADSDTAHTKPGTLGLLIARYRADLAFTDLAPRTRHDYQRVFDYLEPIADTPLPRFNSPLVVKIRDKAARAHGRRFGNYVKAVLSLLFAWGAERGHLRINPASQVRSIRKRKDAPEATRPWADTERHAVSQALPPYMQLPIALMMYLRARPAGCAQAAPDSVLGRAH